MSLSGVSNTGTNAPDLLSTRRAPAKELSPEEKNKVQIEALEKDKATKTSIAAVSSVLLAAGSAFAGGAVAGAKSGTTPPPTGTTPPAVTPPAPTTPPVTAAATPQTTPSPTATPTPTATAATNSATKLKNGQTGTTIAAIGKDAAGVATLAGESMAAEDDEKIAKLKGQKGGQANGRIAKAGLTATTGIIGNHDQKAKTDQAAIVAQKLADKEAAEEAAKTAKS